MPAQGSVHNVQRAPHQTLGTRTRCRARADAARSEPASPACAPRNRRASVWYAEDADGGDALADNNLARVKNIVGIKPFLAAIRAWGACTVVRAVRPFRSFCVARGCA